MQFKYIFLISTLFFVILSKSKSQSCLSGITILTTQAQVDAFPTNYPGCTTILGSLYIVGSNIIDLSPLSQLTAINGFFLIVNNINLTNLNGLQNIQIIGDAVNIVGNSMLPSLSPFNPTSIGNNIQISQNAILNSIDLNNVSNNITGLYINDNPMLISFQMHNLTSISTSSFSGFGIARSPLLNQVELNNLTDLNISEIVIENCGLVNLDFLNNVNGIIEIVRIIDNPNLSNCSNISLNITSSIYINNNDLLTNLEGLNNVIQLGGELNISNNDLLESLSGLESITSIGNLILNNNQLLSSLSGLNNILNMNGTTLNIENNPQLENFLSLNSNLNSNFSEIIIKNNALLSNISNLNNIGTNGYYGGIEIENNPLLQSLEGIYSSSLPYVENFGNFRIVNNGSLSSLSGVDNIYHYGSVEIQNNINLNECEIWGICSLIDDCGTSCFSISNNAVNCNSLTAVQTACDALLPIELTSFFATSKENEVDLHWQTTSEINNHYFEIEHSQNGIDFKSIGRKEGAGNSNALLDYYFVHEDLSSGLHYYRLKQVDYDGQYSYSDIVSVFVKGEGNDVSIYPNPSTNIINVNGANGLYYTIYDLVGRQVIDGQISDDAISIDHLSTGMYYLHLDSDAGQSVYKIWKE